MAWPQAHAGSARMSGVEHRVVGSDEPEQRLDRWFRKHFPHVAQGRIERMCRKGEIRVDGGRVKAATRITPGQVVRVPPLPPADATPPPPETLPARSGMRCSFRMMTSSY